jgi:superoxide dismutase
MAKEKAVTTNELARMVQRGFEAVDERFDGVDRRFEAVDKRFDKVAAKRMGGYYAMEWGESPAGFTFKTEEAANQFAQINQKSADRTEAVQEARVERREDAADRYFNCWVNEHDTGHLTGCIPLLVMDVFEHAFIIDYGTKRADYIQSFIKAIDWNKIDERRMTLIKSATV